MSTAIPTSLSHVSASRKIKDRIVQALVYLAFLLALIPLVSVLWLVVKSGASHLNGDFLTHSMNGIGGNDAGGGAYHAIIGTVEQVLLSSAISVPIGVLTAVYLIEYSRGSRLGRAVSFFVDVMTGVPSIVAALFIFSLWILALGFSFSGFACALALSILMIPTVVRSTEEMLKLVPNDLREAAYALGVPRWRTISFVILPTAITGIITGVMLAVARVMGETAPLVVLAFSTQIINTNPFSGPQEALPLYIFQQTMLSGGVQAAYDRAWAAALTLIVIIMGLNLIARLISRLRKPVSR